jgi:quinol monooxygenase YgiN
MTYSHWEDEGALNAYRSSELFSNLWAKIKPKFSKKPEAWSHVIYFDGFDRNQELSL